ncbi:pilus assembly FimT family protein [Cerasicoccus frondis]|uniref:pilus assembly FimT family protein n=1 Tax=Cerasicoccus frondis TaxID=490090 RepID=UPI00285284F8|nr:prepilin-type N-terminal cleavage/methylation domain-containing protein [Cerasicoccus frondis]
MPSRRRGFSLLEIVFVLAMITLMAGIVASLNMESLISSNGAKPAYEVFREASHEARLQAINSAATVYLSFDAEGQQFLLRTDAVTAEPEEERFGTLPKVDRYGYLIDEEEEAEVVPEGGRTDFPVYEDELEVEFRGIRAESDGLGIPEAEYSAEPLHYLVFHPSGVSTPAVVTLRYSGGDEQTLSLDRFSSGPQLSRDEGVGF